MVEVSVPGSLAASCSTLRCAPSPRLSASHTERRWRVTRRPRERSSIAPLSVGGRGWSRSATLVGDVGAPPLFEPARLPEEDGEGPGGDEQPDDDVADVAEVEIVEER